MEDIPEFFEVEYCCYCDQPIYWFKVYLLKDGKRFKHPTLPSDFYVLRAYEDKDADVRHKCEMLDWMLRFFGVTKIPKPLEQYHENLKKNNANLSEML